MASFSADQKGFQSKQSQRRNLPDSSTCSRCGYQHQRRSCPAYGKTCKKCKKLNHFAQVCKNSHNVNEIQTNVELQDNLEDYDEHYYLGSIKISNVNLEWTENVTFAETDKSTKFKLDTGDYKNLGPKMQFQITNAKLSNYDGSNISVLGKVKIPCIIKKNKINLEIFVTDPEY